MDIDDINFFQDQATIADPHPYFEELRAQCPIRRENHHQVMMVTGYDEAIEIYNDTQKFSSCIAVTGPFPGFPVPITGDNISDLIVEHRDKLPMSDQLPTLDPPTHTDHRALLMRMITPKRLKENEDSMWRLCDVALDRFFASDNADFISGFASPFTLLAITDLLGVPQDDLDDFIHGLQHRPPSDGAIGNADKEMSHSPLEFLYERLCRYVEMRRAKPAGDVLTGMAQATFPDGSTPEPIDVARVAANVFAAGQETTVRLLAASLRLLGDNPELQAQLRADRSLIGNFIEETLRLESPITGDFRLSVVPTTVGGIDMPAGTTVMLINGSANRDPRHFSDPLTFDASRANARQHLSFGRGVHTCPGAPLARAETRIALERLLDRTTDIRISEAKHGAPGARKFRYAPSFILRGLTTLHLEFTMADQAPSPSAEA